MASVSVSVRLDEELVAWADSYAEQRGVKRSRVIEAAVESFRTDAQGGVPDLPESAPRPKPKVRPNVPGVVTARELVMRQRQERINRGAGREC